MHFGEYELSPGLIGLSPPPSAHPEAFQRLLVRPSRWRYPSFSLAKGRSPGFASATDDYAPCSDSLSLRIRGSSRLTSPTTATRRFIMQKARRHPIRGSDRLWADGFRVCFTPLLGVLFTFPSRYWFAIGLTGVFSLAGWSRRIRAGFRVSRVTQDTTTLTPASRTRLSRSTAPLSSGFRSRALRACRGPTTPATPRRRRFGLLRFRSPLLAESLLFSSPAGT